MQRLVPPLELRYAQSRDGRRGVHHQIDFLVDGKTLQQVVGTLCSRELRVLIRQLLSANGQHAEAHYEE